MKKNDNAENDNEGNNNVDNTDYKATKDNKNKDDGNQDNDNKDNKNNDKKELLMSCYEYSPHTVSRHPHKYALLAAQKCSLVGLDLKKLCKFFTL